MTLIKKIATSILISLALATTAFAGSEDWNGQYIFKSSKGEPYKITHSPTNVQFLFFSAGGCLNFNKGTSINGMIIPADVRFCRTDNVETFTKEVQKLGVIISKKITLGPTYTK